MRGRVRIAAGSLRSLAGALLAVVLGTARAGVRYHRLFNDVTGRYMSAAVEWHWLGSAAR